LSEAAINKRNAVLGGTLLPTVFQLRLVTGLIIAVYLVLHLVNHALGIFSYAALDAYREVMALFWRSWPMTVLLHGSLIVHFVLALRAIYIKTTLRMPRWEWIQLGIAILVSPNIFGHIIGTRLNDAILSAESSGHVLMLSIMKPMPGMSFQYIFTLVIFSWVHVAVGLHFWLRLKGWYRRFQSFFYALAVILPVLALLGFARAWIAFDDLPAGYVAEGTRIITEAPKSHIDLLTVSTRVFTPLFFFGVVALTFFARWLRLKTLKARGGYRLDHSARGVITTLPGRTILEALRDANIPHAAVCGGRGRCTTCRVHVDRGGNALLSPTELEQRALARVTNDPMVRLACLVRPKEDLAITPMLPATATARDALSRGGVSGREQVVTAMFVDLRGSTKLGEERLPYDVVFILNQFFADMSAALDATRGHYAQFTGDGLLALYGLEGDAKEGARDALRGVTEMKKRLDGLNERLAHELKTPLKIGIGMHSGEAIVGTMGPPSSPNLSAIGDNINIAARLEAMCKELQCDVVISQAVANLAEVDLSEHPSHRVEVRGREEPVEIYATCEVDNFGV
jgi:adenylate cyclase